MPARLGENQQLFGDLVKLCSVRIGLIFSVKLYFVLKPLNLGKSSQLGFRLGFFLSEIINLLFVNNTSYCHILTPL